MQSTKENPKSLTNLSELQKEIIESVRSGKSLLGKGGALTPLIKQALEEGWQPIDKNSATWLDE